jgi:hypothetical protein
MITVLIEFVNEPTGSVADTGKERERYRKICIALMVAYLILTAPRQSFLHGGYFDG